MIFINHAKRSARTSPARTPRSAPSVAATPFRVGPATRYMITAVSTHTATKETARADHPARASGTTSFHTTRQLKRKVDDTLASMPEELRTALVLRQVEGKSYDEIAAAVGCPVGTVRSRIFRAREILVKAVSPFMEHV